MGLKNRMMDSVMNKMFATITAEEREKMMATMMEKFLGAMSTQEKVGLIWFRGQSVCAASFSFSCQPLELGRAVIATMVEYRRC